MSNIIQMKKVTKEIAENPEDLAEVLQNNFDSLEQKDNLLLFKFDAIERNIATIKSRVDSMTDDLIDVKKSNYIMQRDIATIKTDVSDLKEGVNTIINYLREDPNRPLILG